MLLIDIKVITYSFIPKYAGWLNQTINLFSKTKALGYVEWFIASGQKSPKISNIITSRIKALNINGMRKLRELVFVIIAFKAIVSNKKKRTIIYVPNSYYPAEIIVILSKLFKIPVVFRACHSNSRSQGRSDGIDLG